MMLCAVESAAMNQRTSPSRLVAHAHDRAFLVVARGQSDLLDAVREVAAALGWVDVIEDRRQKPSLLPRQGLSSR
jgi:hypothetical protein